MSDQSTDTALREMSRSIGGLESTVKLMVSTWQSQEASASHGRRELHVKFDALAEKVSGLAAKVDTVIKDVTEIKPSVDAFEDAKSQAEGAQKLGKWIWAMLGLGGTALGWALANWITIGAKPPLH